MRVVTLHAIQDGVLALEQLFILLMVLDEAILGVDLFDRIAAVALATFLRITANLDARAIRVFGMQTAWPVTGLALDARLGPGTNDARQAILIALRFVAGGMAGAAVKLQLWLTRMILDPTRLFAHDRISKIILVEIFRIADSTMPPISRLTNSMIFFIGYLTPEERKATFKTYPLKAWYGNRTSISLF
jgi:hypothetical protein